MLVEIEEVVNGKKMKGPKILSSNQGKPGIWPGCATMVHVGHREHELYDLYSDGRIRWFSRALYETSGLAL